MSQSLLYSVAGNVLSVFVVTLSALPVFINSQYSLQLCRLKVQYCCDIKTSGAFYQSDLEKEESWRFRAETRQKCYISVFYT